LNLLISDCNFTISSVNLSLLFLYAAVTLGNCWNIEDLLMADAVTMDDSAASTSGLGDKDHSVSADSLSEWRSREHVDNGIPSTSPPFWDTDSEDDDPGA
jgi:hypothetical protein